MSKCALGRDIFGGKGDQLNLLECIQILVLVLAAVFAPDAVSAHFVQRLLEETLSET